MRNTFICLFILIITTFQAHSQSWADLIINDLQSGSTNIVYTNYFEDEKLLSEINEFRSSINQMDQLSFDSTGLYHKIKKTINPLLLFQSQNTQVIPIQHKSTTASFYKMLAFEDKGEINTEVNRLNRRLFDILLEENRKKALKNWVSDHRQRNLLAMDGISGVAAMKLLIHIENEDDYVLIKWKFISRFVIQTIPEHMAKDNSYQQLSIPK